MVSRTFFLNWQCSLAELLVFTLPIMGPMQRNWPCLPLKAMYFSSTFTTVNFESSFSLSFRATLPLWSMVRKCFVEWWRTVTLVGESDLYVSSHSAKLPFFSFSPLSLPLASPVRKYFLEWFFRVTRSVTFSTGGFCTTTVVAGLGWATTVVLGGAACTTVVVGAGWPFTTTTLVVESWWWCWSLFLLAADDTAAAVPTTAAVRRTGAPWWW
mmetsp:Transcript_6906/g.29163  ORF Transcript_6906/g.29163 Transcript_6906/m.29163 type:complete len:212 (-) Transcript_6906:100-735(-)